MRRILKINNTPILNFYDLQKEFLPLPLLKEIGVFSSFAKVHCIYTSMITDEKGCQHPAEYLTKPFWQSVIEISDWSRFSKDVPECFGSILAKEMKERCCSSSEVDTMVALLAQMRKKEPMTSEEKQQLTEQTRATMYQIVDEYVACILSDSAYTQKQKEAPFELLIKELSDLQREYHCEKIGEKLQFIQKYTGFEKESRKVVLLLAICALAEQSPLDTDPGIWKSIAKNSQSKKKQLEVSDFPNGSTVNLLCGDTYRYWLFGESSLPKGNKIRTVRLEAKRNGNAQSAKVVLYEPKSGKPVQTLEVTMRSCIYMNVTDKRVIKALPDTVNGADITISRENDTLTVCPKGKESWTTSTYHNVSQMAVLSAQDGFIIVSGGKVRRAFCRAADKNGLLKLKLDSITFPVVEVAAANGAFRLLLDDGSVIQTNSDNIEYGCLHL